MQETSERLENFCGCTVSIKYPRITAKSQPIAKSTKNGVDLAKIFLGKRSMDPPNRDYEKIFCHRTSLLVAQELGRGMLHLFVLTNILRTHFHLPPLDQLRSF
jgi:hypothetical protein